MFYFTPNNNRILLCSDSGEVLNQYTDLCFCVAYDKNADKQIQYTLHKYGEKKFIEEWYHNTLDKIVSSGYDCKDLFGELRILKCPKDRNWPLDLINRAINCTGAVKYLVDWVEAIDV